MATAWEDLKRTAQSAYENIGNSYQQILITGHLYPPTEREQLNREIAEEAYDASAEDWQEYGQYVDEQREQEPAQGELFYKNHFHGHEPEPDTGLEPER